MLTGAWVTVVTALILIGPGALIGRRLCLPWPVAVAAGPAITLGIVNVFSVVYGSVGIGWNLLSAAIGAVIAYLIAWGYAWLVGTRRVASWVGSPPAADDDPPMSRRGALGLVAGVGLGVFIIAVTCIRPLATTGWAGIGTPSQVWDSLWHASSLQWITDTGIASSERMGELMNYDTHGFNYYPNTWHALGALVSPLVGTSNSIELYNTYSPATLAVTVPFGVAALAYWCARHRLGADRSAFIAAVSAPVSALFPSLPYVEIWLTSVPNAVGVSLAPVAAVLVISAVRDRRRVLPAAVALSGVTATHPSGLIAAGVIVGLWWLLEGLWRPALSRWRDLLTLIVTGVLTVILIVPVVLGTIRVADTNTLPFFDFREDTVGKLQGLAQAAFNGTVPLGVQDYPVWVLIVLTVAGLGALLALRCWAGLAAWVIFVMITANSVVSLGFLSGPLGMIGGYFYNSPHRLTFVVALISAAAAGVAVGAVALWVADRLSGRVRWATSAALIAVLVVVAGAAVWRYPSNAIIATKDHDQKLVGADDLAAYEWLAHQPGARDSLILNNLDQGTGWIYPATGLTPLFPFYRANDFSQRQRDLYWGVDKIGADPHIDGIVRDMNVRYVIDSPPSYWWFQNGVPDPANGRQGDPFLAIRDHGAPGLTKVFQQGDVTVFAVNAPPGDGAKGVGTQASG